MADANMSLDDLDNYSVLKTDGYDSPVVEAPRQMIKYRVDILRDLQVVLRFTGVIKHFPDGEFHGRQSGTRILDVYLRTQHYSKTIYSRGIPLQCDLTQALWEIHASI
jgi:hypothetical protein